MSQPEARRRIFRVQHHHEPLLLHVEEEPLTLINLIQLNNIYIVIILLKHD